MEKGSTEEHPEYEEKDLEVVFESGDWESWGDVIRFLDEKADKYSTLTHGRISSIKEDISRVRAAGIPFTSDPRQVFQLAHTHH